MNKQTEDPERNGKSERRWGVRASLDAAGYRVESPTICTFQPEPMIGHIPFVSSSPSSTAMPSLFRDKLVCQNQQEREWLASARVISPWNSARAKLRQQDGSAVARIAEARNVPVEVISVRDWTLFFSILRGFNEWQAAIAQRHLFRLRELNFAFWFFSQRPRQVKKIRKMLSL